jgi:TPR repeat protein
MDAQNVTLFFSSLDKEDLSAAYKVLEPYLEARDAEAQYLYSQNYAHEGEGSEEYESRCVEYLRLSAEQKFPNAMYQLGVLLSTGEGITLDKTQAAKMFRDAAGLGHVLAQVSHAYDLYYGINEIPEDKNAAIKFIGLAIEAGNDGAKEILKKWQA